MKATLQILTLLFSAACAGAAFVGLVGLHSSFAFFTSEAALWLYAVAGLMLIGFNDYAYRRPAITRPMRANPRPVETIGFGRRANAYGIRRRNRIAA